MQLGITEEDVISIFLHQEAGGYSTFGYKSWVWKWRGILASMGQYILTKFVIQCAGLYSQFLLDDVPTVFTQTFGWRCYSILKNNVISDYEANERYIIILQSKCLYFYFFSKQSLLSWDSRHFRLATIKRTKILWPCIGGNIIC